MKGPARRPIRVFETFAAACGTFARNAFPICAAYGVFIVPLAVLFAVAAPTVATTMLVTPTQDVSAIPSGEWLALWGIVLLGISTGALSTVAGADMADRALGGDPRADLGQAFGRAIARLPAFVGTYLVIILCFGAAMTPLFVLFAIITASGGERSPAAAVAGLVLGFLVAFPLVFAGGIYVRFGGIRAAIRGEGPIAALRGSISLVRGYFWRTVGYALLVGLTAQLAMMMVTTVSMLFHGFQPIVAFAIYAVALTACVAFQVLHEVALMGRLAAVHAPLPAAAATDVADEPAPEPPPAPPDAPDDLPVGA